MKRARVEKEKHGTWRVVVAGDVKMAGLDSRDIAVWWAKAHGYAVAAPRKRNTKKAPAAGAHKLVRRRASSRKRNPDLMTVGNPARSELQKAVASYLRFHGIEPTRAIRGKGKGVLIALGELREIVYQPKRGHRKGPAWFHQFKPGNVLAVTADGRRLVIVDRQKRRAVDFDRGIVN